MNDAQDDYHRSHETRALAAEVARSAVTPPLSTTARLSMGDQLTEVYAVIGELESTVARLRATIETTLTALAPEHDPADSPTEQEHIA
jgi:hypothetical protein